jgi:hypothetical protein
MYLYALILAISLTKGVFMGFSTILQKQCFKNFTKIKNICYILLHGQLRFVSLRATLIKLKQPAMG